MSGLPWFELESDMPDHPKSVRLGFMLGDDLAFAYIVRLWAYCYRVQLSDRFVGPFAAQEIERVVHWRGESGRFVRAAIECHVTPDGVGFLVQNGDEIIVHGVADRLLPHLTHRKHATKRQRQRRKKIAENYGATSRVTSRVTNAECSTAVTRESRTNKNKNKNTNEPLEKTSAASGDAPLGQVSFLPAEPPPASNEPLSTGRPKPPSPRFTALRDALVEAFREERGEKYPFAGAKDAEAVKRLASWSEDDGEVVRRWRAALQCSEEFYRAESLAQFARAECWNRHGTAARGYTAVGRASRYESEAERTFAEGEDLERQSRRDRDAGGKP